MALRLLIFCVTACLAVHGPLQALPITTGLALHLAADAGVATDASGFVSSWSDQSGNGRNAMQASGSAQAQLVSNAVNGNAAIRFDGVNDYFDIAGGQVLTSQQFTIIAVANDTAASAGLREIFSNWNGPGGNSLSSVFFGTRGNAPTQARLTDDFLQTGVGVVNNPSEHFVFTGVSGLTDAAIYQDAAAIAVKGAPLSTRNLTGNYVVGRQGVLNGEYWTGDIAELIVFDRELNSTELQQTWDFLDQKYSGAAIPEPGAVLIFAIGAVAVMLRRRGVFRS